MDTDAVIAVLSRVLDPEFPTNIVKMGLVTPADVTITDDDLIVEFAPTSPMCPMGAVIGILMRKALEDVNPGKHVIVRLRPGSHMREAASNNMIMDDQQYQAAIEKLRASGALDRLIISE